MLVCLTLLELLGGNITIVLLRLIRETARERPVADIVGLDVFRHTMGRANRLEPLPCFYLGSASYEAELP